MTTVHRTSNIPSATVRSQNITFGIGRKFGVGRRWSVGTLGSSPRIHPPIPDETLVHITDAQHQVDLEDLVSIHCANQTIVHIRRLRTLDLHTSIALPHPLQPAIQTSAMPSLPRTQKALVATGPSTLALKENVAVPDIEADQVLIKTAAVALNPSDYKLLDVSVTPGAISGSDVAGTVVKVGKDVRKPLKIGDRVFGVIFGANPGCPTNGAFAEYVAATADLCLRVPSSMSFEAAASMGMGVMTVGLSFRALGLEFKEVESTETTHGETMRPYVLVYGGATATGTLAIQLFRLAGYLPVVTCSPSNFELVKSLGAVAAFDYKSGSCKDDIKRFTDGKLKYALDTIGNSATLLICYGAIGDAGGRYTALEQYPKRLTLRRRNVKHNWVLGWTLFGKAVELGGAYARPPMPEDRVFGGQWVAIMDTVLEQGKVRPHPLEVHEEGLAGIVPTLDLLRQGQVKGKKLVFVVR